MLMFVRCFFEHRNNFDGSYSNPLAVLIYAYNDALHITFMRDGIRG